MNNRNIRIPFVRETVCLPRSAEHNPQPTERAPSHLDETRRPRILVIDDELFIVQTLLTILERAGFEALGAQGGFAGLRLAWSWRPDVLLTDFDMPGLNGLEVARRIGATLPDCRRFLLSGHLDAGQAVASARREGHNVQFLGKPIHPADLLHHLCTALVERNRHRPSWLPAGCN